MFNNLLRGMSVMTIIALMASGPQMALAANSYSITTNGSNQYLSIADGSQTGLDLTSNFTIEAWVNLLNMPASGNEAAIVSKWNYDTSGRAYRVAVYNNSGTYGVRVVTSSNGSDFTAGELPYAFATSTWYHLAVVKNGTNAVAYINGIGIGTTTVDSTIANTGASVTIGARLATSADAFLDGKVDDVRIFNIARTNLEIEDDISSELVGTDSGLVAYWKLNNTLVDSTANGNTLTNNGSASFTTDIPFVGDAVFGLSAYKLESESVQSSSVLQNDDELVLGLDANKTYSVTGTIFAAATTSSATPDIIFGFTGPAGMEISAAANDSVMFGTNPSNRVILSPYTVVPIHIEGTLRTASTTGDLHFKWAQSTSNASPTTVMQGSYITAQEL